MELEVRYLATADFSRIASLHQVRASVLARMPWVTKGSLAIADQGIFAGSNFLLNVLLARWLVPAEYGTFALVFSVLLILNVLHNALLTEPMLVFGSGKYNERFSQYLGILLRGHILLMLPCTTVLATVAFLVYRLGSPEVGRAIFSLAIGGPFILLLWLLRRAFYVHLNPGWSAASGGIYLVLLAGSALVLHAAAHLTPVTAFLAMAVASVITSLPLLILLRPALRTDDLSTRVVAANHWRYGKWIAAAAGPGWVMDNIYYLVLPMSMGLAGAGTFKALISLAMPATNTIIALGILLVPALVRDRDAGGYYAMKKTIRRCFGLLFLISGCYIGVLLGFRSQIFHVLYADRYSAYASWPLLLVGLVPLAQCLTAVTGGTLRALELPKLLFYSSLFGGVTAILIGVPFAFIYRLNGALIGAATSIVLMGSLSSFFVIRSTQQDKHANPAGLSRCRIW